MIDLRCGDCLSVLPTLAAESVDLTVTSPPYDNLRTYEGYAFDFPLMVQKLWRVMKPGGVVVWVVGDSTVDTETGKSESGTSFRQALGFMAAGFNLHDTMIYQKNGPSYPSKDKYYQIFEFMFVLAKGKPKTFNPLNDRPNRWFGQKWSNCRTRRNKAGEVTRSEWDGNQGGEFGVRFNIWRYNTGEGYTATDPQAYKHPAIFPEALARDHILSWSNKGDTVLDPMMGSGTVGVECLKAERDFIGIDCCEEYVELARRRITAAAGLFAEEGKE